VDAWSSHVSRLFVIVLFRGTFGEVLAEQSLTGNASRNVCVFFFGQRRIRNGVVPKAV
jgi:hypothetical protein